MDRINNLYCNYSSSGVFNTKDTTSSDRKTICADKEYMSPSASSASRAYALSVVNKNKTIPQMPLKNFIKYLEKQGKVIGEDFEINGQCTMGNIVVILKNKQGKEELALHYDNGNQTSWNCYEVSEYKDGIKTVTCRNSKNEIIFATKTFDKNDARIQHLLKDITIKTTSQEYTKSLKDKNIQYTIDINKNDNSASIEYLDVNNLKECVYFDKLDEKTPIILKKSFNKQGEEYRRIIYTPETVDVITYLNN